MNEFMEPLIEILKSPIGACIFVVLSIWILHKLKFLLFDELFQLAKDWWESREYYQKPDAEKNRYLEIVADRSGLLAIAFAIFSSAVLLTLALVIHAFSNSG